MTKVLRCPECGADKHSITVLRTGTQYCEAELSKDGTAINVGRSVEFVEDNFGESYQCDDCNHASSESTDFIMEIE